MVRLGLAQNSVRLTKVVLVLRISSGLGSARTGSPARVEARASTQESALGLEPSSTHLGSRLYSELALVRLSSGLELDSVWAGKKSVDLGTDESLVNPYGQSSGTQNVVFDTFSMGSQRDTIFFHRICSEPLKPPLYVLGSEFGSAWLGARPG